MENIQKILSEKKDLVAKKKTEIMKAEAMKEACEKQKKDLYAELEALGVKPDEVEDYIFEAEIEIKALESEAQQAITDLEKLFTNK